MSRSEYDANRRLAQAAPTPRAWKLTPAEQARAAQRGSK